MENLGLFEKYLNGSMSESEQADFHNRLSSDPNFKNEFIIHQEVNAVILQDKKRHEFKSVMEEAAQEYFDSKNNKVQENIIINKSKPNLLFVRIAASAAILITLGMAAYFVLFSRPANKELYAQYYSPMKMDVISRSGNDSLNTLKIAFASYQNGKYEDCVKMLDSEKIPDSLSTPVKIVQGLSYMELGDFSKAESLLKKASTDNNNILQNDCLWYLALIYLNQSKNDKCISLLDVLVKEKTAYAAKAESILKVLQ